MPKAVWIHVLWMLAAVAVGTWAGYLGLIRATMKGGRSPLPGRYTLRSHQWTGIAFYAMLYTGIVYGIIMANFIFKQKAEVPQAVAGQTQDHDSYRGQYIERRGPGVSLRQTKDYDYYRDLYEEYKTLILPAAKAGDKDAVAQLTDTFNERIGGNLLFVSVTRQSAANKIEKLIVRTFGDRALPIPKISYRYPGTNASLFDYPEGRFVLVEDAFDGIHIQIALAERPAEKEEIVSEAKKVEDFWAWHEHLALAIGAIYLPGMILGIHMLYRPPGARRARPIVHMVLNFTACTLIAVQIVLAASAMGWV